MRWVWIMALLMGCGDSIDSQLVRVSSEPPGEHCITGGTAVAVGIDRNDNGVLEDREIDTVEYACNGPQGLVETQPEPAGANCPYGGTAVKIGLDRDEDGILDADEVEHVAYVCNSDDVVASLVVTRAEPPGANCSLGGTALLVGRDLDRDGTLDPEEVATTSYVCNTSAAGTLDGNFIIDTQLDIALLAGITDITGGLTSFQGVRDIVLPDLQTVGGLTLQGGGLVKLPALRTVTTGAGITCDAAELPVLETLGGNLSIGSLPFAATQIITIELPALRSLAGDLQPFGPLLTRISAPKLESFANLVQNFEELLQLDLPALRTVGTIQFFASRLAAVDLPSLTMAGKLIVDAPSATVLAFDALADVSVQLWIRPRAVTALTFGALTHVGELRIDAAPALTSLQMPAIISIGGPVTVIAPQLPVCQIDAILAQAHYTGTRNIQAAPCP